VIVASLRYLLGVQLPTITMELNIMEPRNPERSIQSQTRYAVIEAPSMLGLKPTGVGSLARVSETRDLDENTTLDLDALGRDGSPRRCPREPPVIQPAPRRALLVSRHRGNSSAGQDAGSATVRLPSALRRPSRPPAPPRGCRSCCSSLHGRHTRTADRGSSSSEMSRSKAS
jgi:hypothetical protein